MNTLRSFRAGVVSVAVLASAALLGAPAAGAAADPVSNAVTGLQNSDIYRGDPSAVINDQSSLASSLPSFVRIAVLPSGSGNPTDLARTIGADLNPTGSQGLVVGVVAGRTFGAASSRYCSGFADAKAQQAVSDNQNQLKAGGDHPDLTALINEFGGLVGTGPKANTSDCGTAANGTDTQGAGSSGSSGSSVWPWLIAIFVVIGGGIGAFVFARRRKMRRQLAEARAQLEPLYDRLAAEVNTIDPGEDAIARQAISDAGERFSSAGAQLHAANSLARMAAARKTVLEGLYAARTARGALDLDLGAPLPPLADGAEHLTEARPVTVQGQTFQGYPNYAPGAPYYYGGGYGVPGGWYGSPFWETLLIGSVLTGGFGGFGFGGWGGGGYGSGYDAGYQAGTSQDTSNDSGGNWGGGDWGGGGGGGDWGGGGGGSDGGGSW